MDTSSQHEAQRAVEGQVVHLDFFSGDLKRTEAFFGELFGWTFNLWEPANYLLFMDGSKKLGGGFGDMGGKPSGALTHIYTNDIETKLSEIEAAGGKLVKTKTEIPTVGYYALFTDPDGNNMGLFSEK